MTSRFARLSLGSLSRPRQQPPGVIDSQYLLPLTAAKYVEDDLSILRRLSGAASLAALLAGPAFAQQPSAPQSANQTAAGDLQIFEPAYFARYNPSNAQEMVNQVPGFSIQEGDNVRGFGGAAGNVLINGERPSTKTGLNALLQRTPAAAVIRIELVTGQSASLDMRGQTKVVNIVLRENAAVEPVNYEALVRGTQDNRLQGQILASTQRQWFGGQLNLSAGWNSLAFNGPGGGAYVDTGREKYNAAGVSTEHGIGFVQQQPEVYIGNFEYETDLDWVTLRLNGGIDVVNNGSNRYFENYTPDSSGPLSSLETTITRMHSTEYSLGGDVEHKFGADVTGKLITFNSRTKTDMRSTFAAYSGAGGFLSSRTSAPDAESGESILRGQITWKANDEHTIEFSAETAYNFLENITEFVNVNGAITTLGFVDGSDTKVEEYRNEFQVSDVWKLSPSLTIEPGFKFETSTIEQYVNFPDDTDGNAATTRDDLNVEREFEYPKPSITGTWRVSPEQQLRVSYAREVAQLSFSDFVSSVELVNSQTTGGNTALVPERTWAFNAEFEQKFWKGGILTLFSSYDQVEDVQDFVPILIADGPDAGTDPDVVDAPGNIGDGTRWSVGFRATLPLENVGLPGARLDASLSAGGAEVTDPVTFETREFSDEFKESFSVNFRHDLPEHKFSYGISVNGGGPGTAYRFNETSRRSRDDVDLSIWAETSAFLGLRIRAGVNDMFAADFSRTRTISQTTRASPILNRVEQTHSSNGLQPFVRIFGKF